MLFYMVFGSLVVMVDTFYSNANKNSNLIKTHKNQAIQQKTKNLRARKREVAPKFRKSKKVKNSKFLNFFQTFWLFRKKLSFFYKITKVRISGPFFHFRNFWLWRALTTFRVPWVHWLAFVDQRRKITKEWCSTRSLELTKTNNKHHPKIFSFFAIGGAWARIF